MDLTQLIALALVQGITEFLPISSSAHLILMPRLMGTADQGVLIDVALHVGTLGAVLLYFRADTARLLAGAADIARLRTRTPAARLVWLLALATVPVVLAGLASELTGTQERLRAPLVIAITTIGFGLLLWWADRTARGEREAAGWTWRDALLMGLAQVLALVPGTSRSGITITAALLLGYRRADAARLAMLMAVPTILASGTLLTLEALAKGQAAALGPAALAALLAFAAAYAALAVMMRFLDRVGFTPYVLYRLALGAVLLATLAG